MAGGISIDSSRIGNTGRSASQASCSSWRTLRDSIDPFEQRTASAAQPRTAPTISSAQEAPPEMPVRSIQTKMLFRSSTFAMSSAPPRSKLAYERKRYCLSGVDGCNVLASSDRDYNVNVFDCGYDIESHYLMMRSTRQERSGKIVLAPSRDRGGRLIIPLVF